MNDLNKNLVNKVIMYGFNYENNFIAKIWSNSIANHLQSKFSSIYDRKGASAAFFLFYTELDSTNKEILINYINLKK